MTQTHLTDSSTGIVGDHAHVEGGIHFHSYPDAPLQTLLPPPPALIVGREQALHDLKARLGVGTAALPAGGFQILTAIRGWPGVGKTTIAAAIAHDAELAETFPDGVLWTSLGPTPNLLNALAAWGRALGTHEVLHARTLEEAVAQLAALLHNRRMLLIVDDVWKAEHALPFRVGGSGCALLITTRINSVAQELAISPGDIYCLPVLTDDKALELLKILAPAVVAQYPDASLDLIHELEGLPLALQVAGHLLNAELAYGFDVIRLLKELREGAKLLAAKAPVDRGDLASETTPTVAALLQKSTDCLDENTRECYAFLGAFAPKPATFDLDALKSVWLVEDPQPTVRALVERGLLEPLGPTAPGRYQLHALLVLHARSLCRDA